MMTTEEIIYKVHLLLNKNNENKNIDIHEGNIVRLFNREALRFISSYAELNNSSDNILYLQSLKRDDVLLEELKNSKDKIIYKLPEDYFTLIHGGVYSSVEECDIRLYNRIVKPNDINAILANRFTAPSLKWERGVATVGNNQLTVYKNDFNVKKTYISYYKIPNPIDIEGYVLNNTASSNRETDMDDYLVEQVIDRVVLEIQREFVTELNVAATRLSPI